jgi:F-type H+-transporting ATPase subunit epsilon
MKTFSLEIVTPTRSLKKDDVTYLRCPGMDGLFGVLSGHRDALIALNLGEIKISQDNNELIYATSGGFAEISGNKVELLVETIEEAKESVDPKRAELALARAMNRLSISRK